MTETNKKTITVEADGKSVSLDIRRPNQKVQQAASIRYNLEFRKLVKPDPGPDGKPVKGAIVRLALEDVLREQGIWDDAKQAEYNRLRKAILAAEKRLTKGGGKLSEAREVAIQMRRDRAELQRLVSERNSLDTNTAEAQAEQARFNYYVANCTVYSDTGKPFFASEEDYVNRATEPAVRAAAEAFSYLYYGIDDQFEANLPENKFLLKYKLVREGDLHLVDKDGKLIDAKGRRVDEQGRFINEKGELVDEEGNLLTESGDYKVDFVEFEDDIHGAVPTPAEVASQLPETF